MEHLNNVCFYLQTGPTHSSWASPSPTRSWRWPAPPPAVIPPPSCTSTCAATSRMSPPATRRCRRPRGTADPASSLPCGEFSGWRSWATVSEFRACFACRERIFRWGARNCFTSIRQSIPRVFYRCPTPVGRREGPLRIFIDWTHGCQYYF